MGRLKYCLLFPLLLSCAREAIEIEPELLAPGAVTLQVSLDGTSKTVLGEKTGSLYAVNWAEGDCISVNGRGSRALTAAQAGAPSASFTVSGVSAPYAIIYPVGATFGDGVLLPKTQRFTDWGFDPATAIQVGKGTSLTPELHNLCAFLRVTICRSGDETVKQIKVISNDNLFLCGRFSVDFETPSMQYREAGMNCVVMGRPEDDPDINIPYDAEGKCTAFIALPPGTYPKGFTVVVSTSAGDNMVKRAHGRGITLESGQVYPMEDIGFGDNTYRFSGGNGSEANPYLLATSDDITALFSYSNHKDYYVNYVGKHYRQICDITVENKHLVSACREPDKAFTGVYDGDGHLLEYLSVKNYDDGQTKYACGLFAYTQDAVIKNLDIRYKFYRSNPSQITGYYNGGFVGRMTGGRIENCTLSGNMHAEAPYVGGIVGYLEGGIIAGCRVSSSVSGDATVTSSGYDNAYVGGFAGFVASGSIEDCTLTGHVRSVGSCAGGIVGQLSSGTVSGCNVDRAYVYADKPRVGGIAGFVNGAGCIIRDCTVSGIVLSKGGETGGIAGYVRGGDILSCRVLKPATVTGGGGSVGGIAGNIYSTVAANTVTIDGCTVFAAVNGTMNLGGIAGTVNSHGGQMRILSNACAYATLTTDSSNGGSANMGGIAGIVTATGTVPVTVAGNLTMSLKLVNTAAVSGISGIGGIVGNFAGLGELACCWSDVQAGNVITTAETRQKLGSIVGNCALDALPDCYYDANSTLKATTTPGKTELGTAVASFTDGTLLAALNTASASRPELQAWTDALWTDQGAHYPVPEGTASNEGQRTKKTRRISVIGDSISSFDGYIPEGYVAYYPTTTCRTFNVQDMYWYRLAYEKMSDAILDVNIAYSGSLVTYNGNDNNFPRRYIDRGGMGTPDVILLFGGTNDYTAAKPLYGSLKCDTATSAPSQQALNTVFSAADAATTLAAAAANLGDGTYFEAYVKLVRMMVLQYPKVRIVLMIGEHFSTGMQQTIEAIAAHYPDNCRTVDFLSVNGLDGITDNPDWCPIAKCLDGGRNLHPNEAGMKVIADKIYAELGAWLEGN